MRFSLRGKLIAIVGVAAGAFIVVMLTGAISAKRTQDNLATIQQKYLPIIEIGPQLESQFERLQRSLQDAVAARDPEVLRSTQGQLDNFLARLAWAEGAIDPARAAELRLSINDYYETALGVARRMIAGETGERILDAVTTMQTKQASVGRHLKAAISFDRGELSRAFAATKRAEITAERTRLTIGVSCLLLVLVLSLWLGHGVLRSLRSLTVGLERFGQGEFGQPIPIEGKDELQDVAVKANSMAESLQRFGMQRNRSDWMNGALVGLGQEIRGELTPSELAIRAVRFIAGYLNLPAASLYVGNGSGELELLAAFAGSLPGAADEAPRRFRRGEGLIGQAALGDEIVLVSDPPANYLRIRSGLGEGSPRAIVMVPLIHLARVTGVLEVASFREWLPENSEALLSIRENLAIALEVARAREELQRQQDTLRETNQNLRDQTRELETQRLRLEEKNSELSDARRDLEKKAIQLTTISSYKSQFLTNMSHELRTPLNSMLLLSNLLAENSARNLTDKQVEFARTIHVAGQDLLALINQVLDLAKIEAGKHEVRIGPVRLQTLAGNLRMMFEPVARNKGLTFTVKIAPEVPDSFATDNQRLEQILKNLIGNALKFTAQGEVTLEIFIAAAGAGLDRVDLGPGNMLAFAVKDSGVGIAKEDHHRIFAPFEQVNAGSDRRFGGTGLGLSISRELATLLGGELQLKSRVGHGSTFTCFLPLTDANPDATAVPPEAGASPAWLTERGAPIEAAAGDGELRPALPASEPADLRPYLLLIEDDAVFSSVLSQIVSEEGLESIAVNDGRAGIRMARERPPVGIVLDVKLPHLDGWRVMEQLRADPVTASIPVHFVSAMNAPERGRALGAAGFLTKPVTRNDLRAVVRGLAAKGGGYATRVLIVEDDKLTGDSLVKLLANETLDLRHVRDAREALSALERERYGTMILDLSLPDMDGLQLLSVLRNRLGKDMPAVLVYTARTLNDAEAQDVAAQGATVVTKDGLPDVRLLREVQSFIRQVKKRPGSTEKADSPPSQAWSDHRLDRKTILVVDDDMRTVYALSALLRARGAEVLAADTGRVAIQVMDRNPHVDAVLMDIMMPEMDGYEAMRALREDARFQNVPIITLTANAMEGELRKCLDAGASDYLPKPVDADQLITLLHERLSARPLEEGQMAAPSTEPISGRS